MRAGTVVTAVQGYRKTSAELKGLANNLRRSTSHTPSKSSVLIGGVDDELFSRFVVMSGTLHDLRKDLECPHELYCEEDMKFLDRFFQDSELIVTHSFCELAAGQEIEDGIYQLEVRGGNPASAMLSQIVSWAQVPALAVFWTKQVLRIKNHEIEVLGFPGTFRFPELTLPAFMESRLLARPDFGLLEAPETRTRPSWYLRSMMKGVVL